MPFDMVSEKNARVRRIGVVTTSRADFGIWKPVISAILGEHRLDLALFVTGTHLLEEHGATVHEIEAANFPISARIPIPLHDDTARGIAAAIGTTVVAFGELFAQHQPDLLLVLGDRFEMFAAATAAVPFNIPIGHVHGGEVTVGAMDEAFRHAITKMSHLHFASTTTYRDRILQLGEAPDKVFVCGAPSLDNLTSAEPMSVDELEVRTKLKFEGEKPLLVTFHPVTLRPKTAAQDISAILDALEGVRRPIVFTAPNADTENHAVREAIADFVARNDRATLVASLGVRGYFAMLKHAWAMLGNSSSGIIEAASFELPVINVGARQQGRVRGANVIDVECSTAEIQRALARVDDEGFRATLCGMKNPYGDGSAAEIIVNVLATTDLGPDLLLKEFHDLKPVR